MMKLHILCALVFASVCCLAAESEDSPVAVRMKAIARDFKTLSSQAADASQKDSSMELIAAIRKNVSVAKTQKSEPASELSGTKLEEYQKRFAQGLGELDDRFGKLSAAVKAGDSKQITALLGEINTLKKQYHKELR
jgi:soluble cytochrome b562